MYGIPLAQFVGPYQHDDLDLHKESLGTVPVAPDGSAQFRIPAGVPIQLQAVDTNGVAVFTMRSFIYAQKGEVQGCTGCHENKFKSGAAKYVVQSPNGRATHDPKPEVDLGYTGLFGFTKSVQPIFDRHCISCHVLWLVKPDCILTSARTCFYAAMKFAIVAITPISSTIRRT